MSKSAFDIFLPTKVLFGEGKISEIAAQVVRYGNRALLVTTPWNGPQRGDFDKIKSLLEQGGITVIVHDQVVPNPTTTLIDQGVALAKKEKVHVVIGIGGGSSIDAAKAIAVGATHPGTPWDYVYTSKLRPDAAKTLPIIAVTTTSGTGAHVTPYAVFTNPALETKSTIVDPAVFPKVCIVDPALMINLPKAETASTGFDAFSHAFESYTNIHCNPWIDLLALEAITKIIQTLPSVLQDGHDMAARAAMAYADTLAGVSIANVGTTFPHSIGQPISAKFPKVPHGVSLAVVYPEFFRFTWRTCVPKFATLARLFNPRWQSVSELAAAEASVDELIQFQQKIGVHTSLSKLGVTPDKMESIIHDTMACPDTYVTTAVPTEGQVREMVERMWAN